MKKIILLLYLIFNLFVFSQNNSVIKDKKDTISVEDKPSVFPKGIQEFRRMISDNFRMKKIKSKDNIFCEITFIVERDGTLSSIKANGTNENFNNEAVRAVSKIKDRWISAEVNGQKVRSRYRIPLNITYK
jgi:hypothetical protein